MFLAGDLVDLLHDIFFDNQRNSNSHSFLHFQFNVQSVQNAFIQIRLDSLYTDLTYDLLREAVRQKISRQVFRSPRVSK